MATETETRSPIDRAIDAAYARYCETRDRYYDRANKDRSGNYTHDHARSDIADAYRAYLKTYERITGSKP